MMKIFSWLSCLWLSLWAVNSVLAAPSLDLSIHQEYTSTRALGMGNAFTAVADDHSALFYNPAALARRKDGQLRMFLRAGISSSYLDLVSDLEQKSSQGDDDKEVQEITELIQKNYGKGYYSRVPTLGGVWVRPNWGIALIPVDLSIDIGLHRQIGPMVNVNAYQDTTLAYGYARDFKWFGKGTRFSMGATVKALYRIHASEAIMAAELASDSEIFDTSRANEGMTADVDIGTLWSVKKRKRGFFRYIQPSFALVVRNALDYGFPTNFNFVDENSGEPPKLQRRLDVGSDWRLPKFWVFDPHIAVDVRDIGHSNWSFEKGTHAGAELYWKMFNWWKGSWSVGMNQGYWTAGFGARLAWFQLELASWGEEVGTSDYKIESRRYIVEMSLDF